MKGCLAIMLGVFVLLTGRADAHQSPIGCRGNGSRLDLLRDLSPVRPGDTVRYSVYIANDGPFACDITGLAVRMTLPARDGSATGQVISVVSGADLPAGSPMRLLGIVPYAVAVDPGVTQIVVQVGTDGVLHDTALFDHPASINKTLGTDVSPPTGTPGGVGGTVPATLALSLGAPATFGAFVPGVANDYHASTTATVTSTAGDATLFASDPGQLVNGAFALPSPLQVGISKTSWTGPVSNDAVTLAFTQHIGANDALRTGTYSATVTFTLSTSAP